MKMDEPRAENASEYLEKAMKMKRWFVIPRIAKD
jgi:hypothetical protein